MTQTCPKTITPCPHQCALVIMWKTRPNGTPFRHIIGCKAYAEASMAARDALPEAKRLALSLKAGDYHGHKTRRRDASILDLYM